ncbi:MAG: discoidin domain-containing protein [Clostridia bacterium]|nr:discoidin domain-containing protein [Clostridia bacterium]
MKKLISLIAAILIVLTSLPLAITSFADEYENTLTVDIDGYDCHTEGKDVVIYTNNTSSPKDVLANTYYFRNTKVMIFTADGRLMEAGGDMYENSSTVTGSPQDKVTIPAGGFMVGFNPYTETQLFAAFNIAMEDAMLYNSTMSIIYDMKGSYNSSTNKFTLEYDSPKAPSSDAIRFLFVGNSSTYFNGTPIKFKGMAKAAGIEIDVDYCTFGSAYLYEFADETHERGIALRNKLKNNEYDYVMLQDAAKATYSTSRPAIAKILPLIEANGAEALLYMRYSAASTLEQNKLNAIKHHINYTKLSDHFGLECSPAAHAFIYCHEKYPEVSLYAIDGGHHSKEGSYLIAATWLYKHLGVDPVGNAYTADMDSATVAKLQECAKLAVDVGYPFDFDESLINGGSSGIEGIDSPNVAYSKPYTSDGKRYSDSRWTDTGDDLKPIGKLTDGVFAEAGDGLDIGAYSGSSINVVIDLGGYYSVKGVKTDLWGNTWGIADPNGATVTFSYSVDGKSFTPLGETVKTAGTASGNWNHIDFHAVNEGAVARYIKVNYTDTNYSWTSEIAVFGDETETPPDIDPDPDPEDPDFVPPEETTNLILGMKDIASLSGTTYIGDLTDGVKPTVLDGNNAEWFTFYYHTNYPDDVNAPGGEGTIFIDLGEEKLLTELKLLTFVTSKWGINSPAAVRVFYSNTAADSDWTMAGEFTYGETVGEAAWGTSVIDAQARYVMVLVTLNGTFAMFSEAELYGADVPEKPPVVEPEYTLGDVNDDGKIDQYDYILVKRHYFETRILSEDEALRADVNKDNKVDQYDYILIARHYFGTFVIG